MSETMNAQAAYDLYRRNLLTSVSAVALLASVCLTDGAKAADSDADRPPVWIELGGQFDLLSNDRQMLALPFASAFIHNGFTSPLPFEKPQRFGYDAEAKLSYQPEGSDWVLSASVRYGRDAGHKYKHEQTDVPNPVFTQPTIERFRYAEVQSSNDESHEIMDFMAGKDLGLGGGGSSLFNTGIRVVQFHSQRTFGFNGDPDYTIGPLSANLLPKYRHNYHAGLTEKASFVGIGPAVSWTGSAPILGNAENGGMNFDWGLNGALLFGKQKSIGQNEITGHFQSGLDYPNAGYFPFTSHYTHGGPHNRSHMVAVPNLGATAGVSFRYANAKVSFGYHADFFFGAMDGGIDTRKAENVGFYGPFASVSIGFGG